ncbi:hypothetical protein, partial [Pseudomonas sp. 2995-3]|uniref:hypothetical protein n=1 Tax=Pseudomonas sp. 2995-3 TaxID=1712680 RepID=UPI000C5A2073
MKRELVEIEDGFLDIIYLIRETCFELYPPFLAESGLKEALKELTKKFELRSNIILDFKLEQATSKPINKETELAIYRMIQELLNNAMK